MMKISVLMIVAAGLIAAGCNQQKKEEAPKDLQPQMQTMPEGHPDVSGMTSEPSVAGVKWTVPAGWIQGPPRQMRVATYHVPGATEADAGEMAVFYFGSGQGGDVEGNIDRWINQFENPKSKRSSKEVNGMKVELVEIAGTYLAPSGPMMQSSGKLENYRMLGAIVPAPEGSVFFKFTGPAKTIASSEKDFNALVNSVVKQ